MKFINSDLSLPKILNGVALAAIILGVSFVYIPHRVEAKQESEGTQGILIQRDVKKNIKKISRDANNTDLVVAESVDNSSPEKTPENTNDNNTSEGLKVPADPLAGPAQDSVSPTQPVEVAETPPAQNPSHVPLALAPVPATGAGQAAKPNRELAQLSPTTLAISSINTYPLAFSLWAPDKISAYATSFMNPKATQALLGLATLLLFLGLALVTAKGQREMGIESAGEGLPITEKGIYEPF